MDDAYGIMADLIGRDTVDELVAALEAAGYVIIPKEDEATSFELENRDNA